MEEVGGIRKVFCLTPHSSLSMLSKFFLILEKVLPPSSFARNVATLMTGTIFAQALLILISPILTRLYSPEDFGVYALYTSIASILVVFACLGYEPAIVLPEQDEDAANALGLSILICFGMAGLMLMMMTIIRYPLTNILNAPGLAIWLWCVPLSVLGTGLFKAFGYWSTRRKHFRRLAVRQVTQSTVTSATQVGIGITLNIGSGGLIGGLILGQLAATGRLAWQIDKDEGKYLISCISIQKLKRIASRYKNFPLYDLWSLLFNAASTMLPVLLLGYFFTPAVVGYYALGHRVLAMPMNVMGGSIGQVFFPRAVQAQRDGQLGKVTVDMFERLLTIGFVPLMLITMVAPDLFALIFGEQWWTAGQYAQWMSLWLFFQFISSPLSSIYYVIERQKSLLVFNMVMFVIRLIVIIGTGIHGDALLAVASLGVVGAVLYAVLCVHVTNIIGAKTAELFLIIIKQITRSIPYVAFPLLLYYISKSASVFVFAAIASGFIFLLITAYRSKNIWYKDN